MTLTDPHIARDAKTIACLHFETAPSKTFIPESFALIAQTTRHTLASPTPR